MKLFGLIIRSTRGDETRFMEGFDWGLDVAMRGERDRIAAAYRRGMVAGARQLAADRETAGKLPPETVFYQGRRGEFRRNSAAKPTAVPTPHRPASHLRLVGGGAA